jgi:predicted TIM-barrel fold metal-dependent hydrolase
VIGGQVVVDAVFHPWNLSPANQNPKAVPQLEAVYGSHRLAVDEAHQDYILEPEEIFTDISFEAVAHAEFVESPVDLAVIHSLPPLGFTTGNVTDPDRAAAYRDQHPQRFRLYATVGTPLDGGAIGELTRQVRDLGVDGLKLYPAFFYDDTAQGWRLDGEDFATPLLAAARDLGIRHVAIHKALWLTPAPREAFGVDDMSAALARFPEIAFEMVHGGTAFLDQTLDLLERHDNLYMTLETTFSYLLVKPRVFAKVLGRMIKRVGSERLLFASGNNLSHPAPLLSVFANYQFPPELMDEFGLEPLTDRDRANILGDNALRLHDLNREAVIAATKNDEFAGLRQSHSTAPWSGLRSASPLEAA